MSKDAALVDRLLAQLAARGLSVGPGKGPGELLLHGPRSAAGDEVMLALAAFKRQLLERFGGGPPAGEPAAPVPQSEPVPQPCRACGRDVSDPETRERMADPAFCDRGQSRREGGGCPHKT